MLRNEWQESDRPDVITALERLFAAQDRPLTEDKKAVLVDELEATSLPVRQIIVAIERLKRENLASIKAWTIIEAARGMTETAREIVAKCDACHRGIVLMRDEYRYQVALRCTCINGEAIPLLDLVLWNGQNVQYRRGRTLTKEF